MLKEKGSMLLIVLLALVAIAGILFLLFSKNPNLLPSQLTKSTTPTPTVSMEKKYDNPFEEKTQYQNPFSQTQNPFDNVK